MVVPFFFVCNARRLLLLVLLDFSPAAFHLFFLECSLLFRGQVALAWTGVTFGSTVWKLNQPSFQPVQDILYHWKELKVINSPIGYNLHPWRVAKSIFKAKSINSTSCSQPDHLNFVSPELSSHQNCTESRKLRTEKYNTHSDIRWNTYIILDGLNIKSWTTFEIPNSCKSLSDI